MHYQNNDTATISSQAKQGKFYDLWLTANVALRLFLGACIVTVVAMTLADLRSNSFTWTELRSGLILVAVVLVLSVILGKFNARR